MATRAEVDSLAAKAFYKALHELRNDPYIYSILIRAIIDRAKATGATLVAKEMLKEIYKREKGVEPVDNARDFIWWARGLMGVDDKRTLDSSLSDASEPVGAVDVQ